jgi:hypothetical protein
LLSVAPKHRTIYRFPFIFRFTTSLNPIGKELSFSNHTHLKPNRHHKTPQ